MTSDDWELDYRGTPGPYYYTFAKLKEYSSKNEKGQDVFTLYDAPGGFLNKVDFFSAVVEINRSCQMNKKFLTFSCYDRVKIIASVSWSWDPNIMGHYIFTGKHDGFMKRNAMIPVVRQLIEQSTWRTELCPSTRVEVLNDWQHN